MSSYIVYTIKNTAINHLKHQSIVNAHTKDLNEQYEEIPSDALPLDEMIVMTERRDQLYKVWDQLSDEDRNLLEGKYKCLFCLLLTASLLISSAFTSVQDEVLQPRYTNIRSLTASLEISKSGCASCYGKVVLTKSTDTVDLTMELQRSRDDTSWDTVKTWDTSGSGTIYLDKDWYVTSGYSYRVHVTAEVYSSNGTLVETAPTDSLTTSY